ncbi:MAG: ATP-binding protein, partial [Desulfobacterales bacterium]|nr:ATP-binding protein [Desulfobacterales bacterium]
MPSKTVSIKLKNRISELERLDQKLQAFGASIGLSKKCVFQINLAVDELFTNIVKYGFADNNLHYVAITLSHRDGKISIRVEDNGVPFDPAAKQTSELKDPLEHCKIGGLGLHLVKKIMDDI